MSNPDRTPVRVTIFGEEYGLRSEMGEDYTRACAEYVDDRVNAVHTGGHVAEPHKAAILAAMQITDELFRARSENETIATNLAGRITALRNRIDAALEAGTTQPDLGQ